MSMNGEEVAACVVPVTRIPRRATSHTPTVLVCSRARALSVSVSLLLVVP